MTAEAVVVKEVHVAVAVVIRDGRVLIARRPDHVHQGGLLEFPGGKVEPGETVQQALVREIGEETGLTVPEGSLEPVIGIRHDYGDKRVFLDVWSTTEAQGQARGCEGQPVDWLLPEALADDAFPAANRPIIRALRLPSTLPITGEIADIAEGLEKLSRSLENVMSPLLVLRSPALDSDAYCRLAEEAVALTGDHCGVIVHGAPGIFESVAGASGLHLPWREAEKLMARPVPGGVWLGVSCHNADEIAHAVRLGADYVTLGPVAETATHPGEPGIGWSAFQDIVDSAPVPVYGLGGLGRDQVAEAKVAGAQGVAGIRFWWPSN
ncbi:Nudix family hydrolase [Marinobacter salinexigens]|nr:Nudix family hydrolase [Marinobacter salinexigens]